MWCSFSLLKALVQVIDEEIFPMKTHKRLLRVTARAGSSGRHARSRPPASMARRVVSGGVLALALAAGGLGVAVSASPGHAAAAHVRTRAHHRENRAVLSTETGSASTVPANRLPWMY